MWQYIKYKWKRIFIILAIMGPGLITAFADNDASGVSVYSVAAAQFGYLILIITIPMTLLLAVTQEIGARLAIVAEKGLADLIRERYGVRTAIWMFVFLFIVNMVVVIMDVSGIKSALTLFGLNPYVFVPIIVGFLALFVVAMNYKTTERFFLVLIGFYIMYIVSAVLAKPDWGTAFKSLIIPHGTVTPQFLYTAIAVLGTTVTAWGQFFINSYVKDKHVTVDNIKYNRWEIYLGAFLTDAFSFFMMVAVIATLYVNRVPITDAAQAAMAIRPFAGDLAGILFGLGLLVAGMLGCIIVPLSTAYAFSEFFGYSGSLDEDFRKSKLMYTIFFVQLIIGTLVVMIPQVSLFTITVIGNFINGAILPVIFYFLYQFANNEAIMGEHRNNRLQNWMLVGSGALISLGSIAGVVGQLAGW